MVAIRPSSLDSGFVGQTKVRKRIRRFVGSATARGELPDHILFTGGPGRGKTTLALIVAQMLGAPFRDIEGSALNTPDAMVRFLRSIESGDVRFIDEVEDAGKRRLHFLYRAMEDHSFSAPGELDQVKLPDFMLIAATTDADKLPSAFRRRFDMTINVKPYSARELAQIVTGGAEALLYAIDADAALCVGLRSRGTPSEALRLMRRARDVAAGGEVIRLAHVLTAMEGEGIDSLGLNDLDRRVLRAVAVTWAGKAIGIDPIVSYIDDNDARTSIKYLQRIGLILQTRGGQVATTAGYAHLQLDGAVWTT